MRGSTLKEKVEKTNNSSKRREEREVLNLERGPIVEGEREERISNNSLKKEREALNLERGLIATIERKASSSKMTTSRIEITPTMLREVLKTTIVEKEASRATRK
jgi:hypothetical protein